MATYPKLDTFSFQRPAQAADATLLRRLFEESATPLPGLTTEQYKLLGDMQWRGREQTYAAQYPDATDQILCLADGTPVGRHLISPHLGGYRTVDLAILRKFQRRGLATAALLRLQLQAKTEGCSLSLRVIRATPALLLYERLGFQPVNQDDLSFEMLWPLPFTSAPELASVSRVGSNVTSAQSAGARSSSQALCSRHPCAYFSEESLRGNERSFGQLDLRDRPIKERGLHNVFHRSLKCANSFVLLAIALCFTSSVCAQGILTVTPGGILTTAAGNGAVGYSGDGSAALAATIARPSGVAYDSTGDLFLADANNHVVREVSAAGVITTIAGTGTAGFGGDGGPATSAYLDTPTGVAVDASGTIYIADSHNHRVREVSGGTITTVAGTGTAGFSGDGAAASAAQLALPSAVAIDASGNLYIADTNNNRVRKVAGGTITTVAGNGEELFAGDGGAATAASLDLPTGVAVDASGNIYIADRHNQRIRMVNASGTISTFAGSGTASFAGGFGGDGASAASATLSKPTGVSVDATGNVYVADTNNQRIRQIGNGAIATVAGTGDQGFGGDGGVATAAVLNAPGAIVPDALGNLVIADTRNQRLRSAALPALSFSSQGVGVPSVVQTVTLSNTGSAPLVVSAMNLTGSFAAAAGGSCPALPITLAVGASCTEDLTFLPTSAGAATGTVNFGGTGVVPQQILLAGTAVQGATTVALTSNLAAPFPGQPVTFTASVSAGGNAVSNGTVTFYDGAAVLGTATLSAGTASITTTALPSGAQSITASFAGTAADTGSTSAALTQMVEDFNFALQNSSAIASIEPGKVANFGFNALPVAGIFNYPITLSATGLPPGATITFAPPTLTPGTSPATFNMTVQTAATTAALHRNELLGGGTATFALLLLPFTGLRRRRAQGVQIFIRGCVLLASAGALAGLTGCGTSSGFFGQPQQSYNITVTATAAGMNGATLQHSSVVTLTIQ